MYGYGFYYDRTYILLIIGMLLSVAASAKLKSTFAKYRGVRSASGLTGEQAARRILQAAGHYRRTGARCVGKSYRPL